MAEAFLTNQNYSFPALINLIYPIGSIYFSVNSTSPQQLFGGEWEQIKDKFLLSAGDTYSSGSEGGEATHALTVEEMPSHNHSLSDQIDKNSIKLGSLGGDTNYALSKRAASYDYTLATNNTGGGAAHNNMPPYIAVYVWKRIA